MEGGLGTVEVKVGEGGSDMDGELGRVEVTLREG